MYFQSIFDYFTQFLVDFSPDFKDLTDFDGLNMSWLMTKAIFQITWVGFCQKKVHFIKIAEFTFCQIRNMNFGQQWSIQIRAILGSKLKDWVHLISRIPGPFHRWDPVSDRFTCPNVLRQITENSMKGKNKDEIKVIEKRVASELDAFRTEKFMYFLFINALWIIISSIVLMYTGIWL